MIVTPGDPVPKEMAVTLQNRFAKYDDEVRRSVVPGPGLMRRVKQPWKELMPGWRRELGKTPGHIVYRGYPEDSVFTDRPDHWILVCGEFVDETAWFPLMRALGAGAADYHIVDWFGKSSDEATALMMDVLRPMKTQLTNANHVVAHRWAHRVGHGYTIGP